MANGAGGKGGQTALIVVVIVVVLAAGGGIAYAVTRKKDDSGVALAGAGVGQPAAAAEGGIAGVLGIGRETAQDLQVVGGAAAELGGRGVSQLSKEVAATAKPFRDLVGNPIFKAHARQLIAGPAYVPAYVASKAAGGVVSAGKATGSAIKRGAKRLKFW